MLGDQLYLFLLAAGALQGLILGIILWRQPKPHQLPNRILATILFFFTYRLLSELLSTQGIGTYQHWSYYFFLEYNWVYGALIYFYVQSYLNAQFRFDKTQWVHLIPVAVEILISTFIKSQNLFWDGTRESLSWVGYYGYYVWVLTPLRTFVALGLVLYYVYRSRKMLTEHPDPTGKSVVKHLRWLELFLLVLAAYSVVVLLLSGIDYLFFDFAWRPFYYIPTYIGMAALTYWLGLMGFARRREPPIPQKPSLSDADLFSGWETVLAQLNTQMKEEKQFTDPQLNLASLAESLEIKSYQLTQLLNRKVGKSFNDYINDWRVEEVRRLVNDPAYSHYSLMAIAYEAGFNSKASFNRIVKKVTGKSPRELKHSSEG